MDKIWGNYDGSGNLQHILRNPGDTAPFQAATQALFDCCCVDCLCVGDPCSALSDSINTPAHFSLTLAGISGVLDGDYCIVQDVSNPCRWSLSTDPEPVPTPTPTPTLVSPTPTPGPADDVPGDIVLDMGTSPETLRVWDVYNNLVYENDEIHEIAGGSGCVGVSADPPDNTCNSCDPAIPDTLYVTFPSGLTGWLAPYAGNTYALPYFRNCEWYMYGLEYPSSDFDQYSHGRGDDYVAVMYDYAYGYDWSDGSPQWHVEIADTTSYYCILEWWAVGCSECDPRCNYDTIECDITSSSCGFGCSSDVPSNEYPTVAYL